MAAQAHGCALLAAGKGPKKTRFPCACRSSYWEFSTDLGQFWSHRSQKGVQSAGRNQLAELALCMASLLYSP